MTASATRGQKPSEINVISPNPDLEIGMANSVAFLGLFGKKRWR